MEEFDRGGIAAVLAADAELELLVGLAALLSADLNQLSYAVGIDRREWILRQDVEVLVGA